jgi:hypothetical protein
MLYLLIRFPAGTAAFSIAVSVYGVALMFIAAPLLAPLDGIELGIWDPSTVLQGLALLPLGLVLLPVAAWISEGTAWASRALARWGAR